MRRKVNVFIIIAICFLLQTTLFRGIVFRIDLAEPSDYRRVVLRVYAWEKRRNVYRFCLWASA